MRLSYSRRLPALGLALALAAGPVAAQERVNPTAAALKEFTDQVARYVEIQGRAEKDGPALPEKAEPEQVARYQAELAERIRSARRGANQGDVFTPNAAKVLRPILRTEFRGPGAVPARQTVTEGNPKVEGSPPVLAPNAAYPKGAPLSSVPPTLLQRLPPLPEGLQYQFVGRDLILLDVKADIVVDYMREVVPR